MIVDDVLASFTDKGYFLLREAFSAADCDALLSAWANACDVDPVGIIRSGSGAVYGARNLIEYWPDVVRVMRRPSVMDALRIILGTEFGLVRVLYFDKPPGESWALPWHRDMAIAVRHNRLPSTQFSRPTTKHGVPHVDAPEWLLKRMVTARLHLDDVTDENGPLRVMEGSHASAEATGVSETKVLCSRGDVLLMRPLLLHASGHSSDGTELHRRILHLEFCAVRDLPDGYAWQTFAS